MIKIKVSQHRSSMLAVRIHSKIMFLSATRTSSTSCRRPSRSSRMPLEKLCKRIFVEVVSCASIPRRTQTSTTSSSTTISRPIKEEVHPHPLSARIKAHRTKSPARQAVQCLLLAYPTRSSIACCIQMSSPPTPTIPLSVNSPRPSASTRYSVK